MTADLVDDEDERARADAARLSKATERVVRNLTDHPSWTRQLSAVFGVPPDIALPALKSLVDEGEVESTVLDGRTVFRLAPSSTT